MRRLWFITNPASGSAGGAKAEAIEAVFAERGLVLVGRTHFPEEPLPKNAALDAAEVDTVVLFAGDGTINAAACSLAEWDGAILILPGGTMNLLAKTLHGVANPAAIVHAAHAAERRIALPYIEAGPHRAFVGLIIGPAASWATARELVRRRALAGLGRVAAHAWRKTFGRGVWLQGAGIDAQAVFVRPADGLLDIAAVDARDLRSIATLGWEWLTGDWVAAEAVTQVQTRSLRIAGTKPIDALFDGEPGRLAPGATIGAGTSRPIFLATREDA
jgi:diacylglycerol kinase family enzyme